MPDLHRTVVVALAFIRQGDSILLVRQREGPGYWGLPGGVLEAGESVDQAAIREVKEETGLDVRLLRLVGLYSKPAEGALAVTFEAEAVGGALLQATDETIEARYFPVAHLPQPIRSHLRQRVEDLQCGSPSALWRTQ